MGEGNFSEDGIAARESYGGVFCVGGTFHRELLGEGRNFSWRMSQIYPHYLKNDQKLHNKNNFFQLKQVVPLKLKTNKKNFRM